MNNYSQCGEIMDDFIVTYSLTAEQYSKSAVKAAMAIKIPGKAKAAKTGFTELVTAVAGAFLIPKAPPLYALLIGLIFLMGIYSLCFYSVIYPRRLKAVTIKNFNNSSASKKPVTLTLSSDEVSYSFADEKKSCDFLKATLLISDCEAVITTKEWSAVVPKESVENFSEIINKLKSKSFCSIIPIK